VATGVTDNPGLPVTNAAEDIATQLVAAYKLDVDRLVWIEHYCYPDEGHKFDLAHFTWENGKASATVKLIDGTIVQEAEIHWYEAHGIGMVGEKIKRAIRW
jgi:hypothetical protein